ncbi:MAG: hypothetical protein M0Q90_14325 [Bacteroidales bacterium]|nr:hypothetical protein [Bacteroidales bacterium]
MNEIREKIQAIAGNQGVVMFTAEVVDVDDTFCTIDYGGNKYGGVMLFSIGQQGKFLLKPAIGSMVTVADLSAGLKRDLCLVRIDKLERFKIEHNGLVFEIDGESAKIDMSHNGVSLSTIFEKLAEILKTLKVAVLTPNSPSGAITPDTLALVTGFEMAFKSLLK